MMFNSSKNKYYESNPLTKNKNNKFNKDMQKQKRQTKNERKNYKKAYKKKGYKLALYFIQLKDAKYVDDSGIVILKENDLYIVECADGLDNEEKISKVFVEYNEVIDYLNEFYDYKKIEEHYKMHPHKLHSRSIIVTRTAGARTIINDGRIYLSLNYNDWEEW